MTDVKIQATGNEVVARDWNSINWCDNAKIVRDLRQRIFRASRQGNRRKVRSLQRLMLKCTANRETSIRQVTQINAGRSTPGIDKVTVKTPAARTALMQEIATYEPWKAQPVQRVYIPKANGKQRPLGIPTIRDRCMQAIVKNALEPEWEAKFEPCSYGFRPGRSCHDAIEKLFRIFRPNKKKKWVVDADISGAFDNIQHETIAKAIQGFPGQHLVKAWLTAGIMEKNKKVPTEIGTPQGGVISPLLANIALHGMEKAVGVKYGKEHTLKGPRALVRYADDFVICTETKEDAEQAQAEISEWLKERGLALSLEKTRIRHIQDGFDFLGFTLRHYPQAHSRTGWKLLTTPSQKSVASLKHRLKQEWHDLIGHNAQSVISKLNPIIRGWRNYFRTGTSKETFNEIDHWMWTRTYQWCRRTHPLKSQAWRNQRYLGAFKKGSKDKWIFGGREGYLLKFSWIPIKRHIMVTFDASPDDPNLQEYWEEREERKAELLPSNRWKELARRQRGSCPRCLQSLANGEELHVHHIHKKSKGGSDAISNLRLVHLYCHLQIHGKGRRATV
ncbi:MAG: group II intron reverse transcriptase/maturase [Desulfurellaceae bacterium]|nr:group II intron reverse transcriptase/maturase [Desulfurellaceae bacterium]